METNKKVYVLGENTLAGRVHPGEILKEELRERSLAQKDFAGQIGMQPTHLSALIHGKRNITTDLARRLEEGLGIPAYLWLGLQNQYNLHKKDASSQMTYSPLHEYPDLHAPAPILCEQEGPMYGSGLVTRNLQLPAKDLELLHALSERMGWHLSD